MQRERECDVDKRALFSMSLFPFSLQEEINWSPPQLCGKVALSVT